MNVEPNTANLYFVLEPRKELAQKRGHLGGIPLHIAGPDEVSLLFHVYTLYWEESPANQYT